MKWTFPLSRDSHNWVHVNNPSANFPVKSQFHLRPNTNICMETKEQHTLQEGHLCKYILLLKRPHVSIKKAFVYYLCFDYAHIDPPISTSHNFMPIKYFILTSLPICSVSEQWNTRSFRGYKTKWNELDLVWNPRSLALLQLAWHYLQSRNSWDGVMEDGSELNLPEVQRHLSTQIHSKLFCGAQLSAQPVPRLDFCTALQTALQVCANNSTLQQLTVQYFHCRHCWTVQWPTISVRQSSILCEEKSPLIH